MSLLASLNNIFQNQQRYCSKKNPFVLQILINSISPKSISQGLSSSSSLLHFIYILLCLTLDNKGLFSNTSFFDLVNLLQALFFKLILFYGFLLAFFFNFFFLIPITCLLFLQFTTAQTLECKIIGVTLIFPLLFFLLWFSCPKAPTPITKGHSVSFRHGVKTFIHRCHLLHDRHQSYF